MKMVTEHASAYGMGVDYAYTMVRQQPLTGSGPGTGTLSPGRPGR